MKDWTNFVEFCYSELKPSVSQGRRSLEASRIALTKLISAKVIPFLTEVDKQVLFPLGFDPEASDLKVAAGFGLERQLISASEYRVAIEDDLRQSPLSFLRTVSGKTFGESIAPKITKFWIEQAGDILAKQPGSAYFDLTWKPFQQQGSLRIELKASSEAPAYRFQQIREPYMSGGSSLDYDVLLCLGATNSSLEWWVIPTYSINQLQQDGILTNQHGGQKSTGNTLWMVMNKTVRNRLADFSTTSEALRTNLQNLIQN